MIIGIVPSVIEKYKNQLDFNIEEKLIIFLKKIFPKSKLKILINNDEKKINYLIISGGNDLVNFKLNKRNLLRYKLTNFYYNLAIKKKIPIVGICYGAQFIAFRNQAKIVKTKNHVGTHWVFFSDKKKRKFLSHHNYAINDLPKKFDIIGLADDNTIELFKLKKKNILGIMWHPERQKKISKIEKNLLKKICT